MPTAFDLAGNSFDLANFFKIRAKNVPIGAPPDKQNVPEKSARICVNLSTTKLMFTGLIEEVGSVVGIDVIGGGARLQIVAPLVADGIQIGDSVAVNGCCLTVTVHQDEQLSFDLLGETLDRTNLKTLRPENRINLERALAANARLGGHFVQGHVDCTARILALEKNGADHRLEVELPGSFAHYVIEKGSIAVNGISLTVAELSEKSFVAWLVSHTNSQTNLGTARVDDLVNLEFDLIAKYLERLLHCHIVPS